MPARIISVASVVMTLPMRVHKLPDRGGAATATMVTTSVGGAFNVMSAATTQGVDVVNACPIGTGPNSALVRRAMARAEINTVAATVVGDTGMKLVLLEADGVATSIHSPGVEADLQLSTLECVDVRAGDIIYISAGDLVYPSYFQVLTKWLPTLPAGVRVAFAGSPLIDQVPTDWIRKILPYCQLVTVNQREAAVLARRFGIQAGFARNVIARELPEDCIVVRRSGAAGCTIQVGRGGEVHHLAAYHARKGDTIGVGETHIGVQIAHLALNTEPLHATRLANAAAAVAVSVPGAPWTPRPDVLAEIVAGTSTVAQVSRPRGGDTP